MSSPVRKLAPEPARPRRLVLFDIDGTILWTDGAGRRAVFQALEEHFGKSGPGEHRFDGKTDPQIVRELMRTPACPTPTSRRGSTWCSTATSRSCTRSSRRPTMASTSSPACASCSTRSRRATTSCSGCSPATSATARTPSSPPSASTRRVSSSVRSDPTTTSGPSSRRSRAAAPSARSGFRSPERDLVVIGDTPADVACGVSIGARAIGVATGRYSVDELRACDAAAVFPDLSDTAAVMRAILAD